MGPRRDGLSRRHLGGDRHSVQNVETPSFIWKFDLLWATSACVQSDFCVADLAKAGSRDLFCQVRQTTIQDTALAAIASFLFLLARGWAGTFDEFVPTLGKGGIVAMFQTFMEGFAIGCLLYRVGAWIGIGWTSVVVAILFMAAHIPNYTGGAFHLSLNAAILVAAAHAGISVLIFVAAWRSQDIIVLGMLHWFINRASDFTTT